MGGLPGGTTVAGRYRIDGTLGHGGMGVVYKARDLVDNRIVVLKLLHRPADTPDARRQLPHAARPRLDHPNILRVIDQGSTPDGLFEVSEFVDGRSLEQILHDRGRLEPNDAIEIAIRVGVALGFAHRQGVIHRDIKPSNIIVSTDGHVLLADFDLVIHPGMPTATEAGTIVGTPAYMSPEQAAGQPLDERSDIFSLGAVLYEALTGRHWWSADGSRPAPTEILIRVVEQQPVPVRTHLPDLPESVERVLDKSLAKNRQDRYDIAEDFVKALLPSPAAPLARLVQSDLDERRGPAEEPDDPTADFPAYLPQAEHRLREFATLWDDIAGAVGDDRRRFVALTETLARGLLREAIGYRIGDAIPHFRGTVGFMLEAPFLWIRQSRFPLLFVNPAEAGDILDTVVHQLAVARATEFFAVLIVVPPRGAALGSEAEALRRLVDGSVYRHDFVVLDRQHLESIIAPNSSMPLIEIIFDQFKNLSVLSPYVVRGPVPEQMFFGREGEVKAISQSLQRGDHAVVGGRRIGKSSTLLRLKRLLCDDPRYLAIYMDCESCFEEGDFLAAMREHVELPGGAPSSFRPIAQRLRAAAAPRTVVLLLDEIDELLAFDAARRPAGQLFKTLRSVSQEGACRFVFSGSRVLFQHLRDASSPFFNFCDAIPLRRLDRSSVAEIARKPMRQLGIEVADEERVIQQLADVTSCHPNLAQWLCDRLVRSSVERRISPLTLAEVIDTPEFRDYYLSTAWGDATPLEKLISVTMSSLPFGVDDVMNALAPYGIRDRRAVREALDFLHLYALLDGDGDKTWQFGLQQFPAIARASGVAASDVDALAAEARRQCS